MAEKRIKKSMLSDAADAMKSVAGAALGAAAVAATGVVVARVAGAIRQSGKQLEASGPELQKLAGDSVSKPLLPTPKKRSAAKRTSTIAKKKIAARTAAKMKRRQLQRAEKSADVAVCSA